MEVENATYIAWYATKIAISTGPSKYWGIPGLILELQISQKSQHHVVKFWTESVVISNKKLEVEKPGKGTVISIKEINRIYNEANERQNKMFDDPESIDKD